MSSDVTYSEKEIAILHHALEVGKEAANAAASLLRECYALRAEARERLALSASAAREGDAAVHHDDEDGSFLDIETKAGDTDLVTKYDKACEDIIIKILKDKTPSFLIISEETNPDVKLPTEYASPSSSPSSSDNPSSSLFAWIIDPIDGTMDFVHGLMDCCVSIGLAYRGRPTLGIVHCPFVGPCGSEGELVYGGKAVGGAWLNGRKLRPLPSATLRDMSQTIVSLNMPWRQCEAAAESATRIRRDLLSKHRVRGIRMYGAAVFQEVQVALGRIDAYSEPGGKIWDVAAGAALIEAVGGTVLNLEGDAFSLQDHTITCGASREVAEVMAGLCKEHDFRRQYWA